MAGSVDSRAVFLARAEVVGIEPAGIALMDAAGLNTMAKWAFSTAYSPGSADDSAFKDLLRQLLGADPSTAQLSC